MSQGICRLGDLCSGHTCWPPRVNNQASPNVFVNNIAVHRQGDAWSLHCCPDNGCHTSTLQAGSSTVYINNKQCGRIGDPVVCGSTVAQGSSTVFAG